MKSYRYVDGEYEIRQEIKRSEFIATVKGEVDSDAAEDFVREVRRRYPDATHNCYAYIGDELGNMTRFSDDGEPGGTAGQPILEVLKKQDLRKTAIVVTRYFGGIKLGAGGLVGAYSGAAAEAVRSANISQKVRCVRLDIVCDYADITATDRVIRRYGVQDGVEYGDSVRIFACVKEDDADCFAADVSEATLGRAKVTNLGVYAYKKL